MLPQAAGIGFKPLHFDALLSDPGAAAFIEVHAENYMGAGGPPHARLKALRDRFALSVHGVGLSIGSPEGLDVDHLARLQRLCARYRPESFSEHLAWSSHGGVFYNDLLPLPYTQATLDHVCRHVDQVQDVLKRRMLLENPSTYLRFEASDIPETEFLAEVVRRTGCGLLLDVNNVFVACRNADADPQAYIDRLPLEAVGQIHLAGHHAGVDETGAPLLIDVHGSAVADPVWDLFERVLARTGPLATLIEWDNDLPDWPTLHAEAAAAARRLDAAGLGVAA